MLKPGLYKKKQLPSFPAVLPFLEERSVFLSVGHEHLSKPSIIKALYAQCSKAALVNKKSNS